MALENPWGARTIKGREAGSPSGLSEDGELLAEGQLDEGLLTLAAKPRAKPVR